jgi:RimJ/RimL family protein N-acetyltransferase
VPWVASEQSIDASEIYCRTAEANFISRKDMPYLIWDKSASQILGATGLHRTVWETPKTEVGYWCRTSHRGRGFITEAVNAVANIAFTEMKAVRLEVITDEENTASRRVAERCGFTLEGTLRNERRAQDGELRHTCIYAKLPTAV